MQKERNNISIKARVKMPPTQIAEYGCTSSAKRIGRHKYMHRKLLDLAKFVACELESPSHPIIRKILSDIVISKTIDL